MSEPDEPASLQELGQRLKDARHRIGAAQRPGRRVPTGFGMGAGFRIAVEMLAALVVGTGLGLVLDRWMGTTPWLMIVFFFLGCGGAMVNVMRTARELENQRKARAKAEKDVE